MIYVYLMYSTCIALKIIIVYGTEWTKKINKHANYIYNIIL